MLNLGCRDWGLSGDWGLGPRDGKRPRRVLGSGCRVEGLAKEKTEKGLGFRIHAIEKQMRIWVKGWELGVMERNELGRVQSSESMV